MKKKTFQLNRLHIAKALAAGLIALLFTSCKKQDIVPEQDAIDRSSTGLSAQAITELKTARSATEKYRSINTALADGYVDINVIQQNMGFHLLKAALLDTVFNPATPEILVYNKQHDGSIELVAVEYAVPIPLSPNKVPEGFDGSSDAWSYSTTFNLWLLHSWVWAYNPQGIFNPTNPTIHLH
jgi:hypothetical protein